MARGSIPPLSGAVRRAHVARLLRSLQIRGARAADDILSVTTAADAVGDISGLIQRGYLLGFLAAYREAAHIEGHPSVRLPIVTEALELERSRRRR